jgi:hypothetical protein
MNFMKPSQQGIVVPRGVRRLVLGMLRSPYDKQGGARGTDITDQRRRRQPD